MPGVTPLQALNPHKDREYLAPRVRRPVLAGVGRLRKIAILGGAHTIQYAPWTDPSWETWAHASCLKKCVEPPDVLFDLHPKALWNDATKKRWNPEYASWIRRNTIPIYMQEKFREVPASMKYPFARVMTEFPTGYITNQVGWMIALALMEGVTHIGLFGCHYDSAGEYGPQRGCAEYWCGMAEGRGVHVLIPPGCDLLNNPSLLYGYESHPDGVIDASYRVTVKSDPALATPKGPVALTVIDPEKADGRPPLMDLGEPVAWDRSQHLVHA